MLKTGLFIIDRLGDKCTPTEISRWFIREPNTVSELVSRMEKRKLVRQTSDPERKRIVMVELIEKGKERRQQALKRESIQKRHVHSFGRGAAPS
ncbi:MAG: winged helix DNA-binding protein [Chloroflexi bacterium]|nr:winged helix DNA-binding protein [Chloroflexota bacterium]